MNSNRFELMPLKDGKKAIPLVGKRMLVGSSRACEIFLDYPGVSGIHAIIEVNVDSFKIYDMNSLSGTFVSNKKVISCEFQLGDVLKFGVYEFQFKNFVREDVLIPELNMLDSLPPQIEGEQSPPKTVVKPNLPKSRNVKSGEIFPRVEYPLAADPKAEFSEYIFEDTETLYPIFDYSVIKTSVEVIIMFKDRVLSIDYIPQIKGMYSLAGVLSKGKEIEYPYLASKEKVPFVEIKSDEIFVHGVPGYKGVSIGNKTNGESTLSSGATHLEKDDVLIFTKGDLQIFVRGTDTPPKVAPAPLFGRDKELKKYFLIMFLLVFVFLTSISLFEVDKEIEEEKAPERIATILYKRKKLVIAKSPAITKTKKAPKKVVQKSPTKKKIAKVKKKIVKKVVKKKSVKVKKVKNQGSKSPNKNVRVKKVTANKAKRDNLKVNKVVRVKKKAGAASKSRSQSNRRKSRNRKSKGAVETYKSFEFKSSLNSLMAKGGGTKSIRAKSTSGSSGRGQGLTLSQEGATLKSAKVSTNVGSLSGSTDGRLDSTRGAKGIVGKKRSIYTAGLPYKTVIRGGMDPDVIRQILINHLPQFRYCYQRALDKSSASFNGIVKLSFLIGASGHVTKAGVNSSSRSLPVRVKSCVVNVLKGIVFPKPLGGGVVEVNQPFNFYPTRK